MESLVKIADGNLRGAKKINLNGEHFHSFLCIPYGKPPIGNLRFKAPQPVEPWQGVKDATKEENTCFQADQFTQQFTGTEDCLSLHVFTKTLPNKEAKLKPVMVFIHGGGFMIGSHETNIYGPNYLMNEDIVLVTITYRLGILGFLSLKDLSLDVPGNAALKDQVLALKWVQRNIRHFNGDPNNVTIFGESAGAASTELLMLSPMAKNLFHKAIMQSGSALNHWALGFFDPADFAKYLGEPNVDEKELLRIMTEMPVEQLCKHQIKYIESKKMPGNLGVIGPVIEKPNPTAFLTERPIDLIQSGNYNTVPTIIGYNDAEGIFFEFLAMLKSPRKENEVLPIEKMLPYETDTVQVGKIVEKLRKFYSGNEKNVKINLLSDAFLVNGILTSAKNHAKYSKNPVYLYRFSLVTELNFFKKIVGLDSFEGACHADELGYLFQNMMSAEMGEMERLALDRMVTMWTNFAKYGNPTPEGNKLNIKWKSVEDGRLDYLEIGKELKMGINPDEKRMNLWKEVYQMNPLTAKY